MKSIFLLAMMLIVLTAGAQKKKDKDDVQGVPVNINYCLPKVSYKVEVTTECIKYIPGPYWKYAEKELRIKPEITAVDEEWVISNIEIKPEYIPDEKAVYSISAVNDYTSIRLSLSGEGFLAGVSGGSSTAVFNVSPQMKYVGDKSAQSEGIDIMKLNTYNNLKEVLDTNYTYQEIDGETKKIWDPIIRYVQKTEADNVKEAVSEIFRIRSTRVKLLAADNDVPDGKSLEVILKQFDKMEAGYLSLFLGKTERHQIKRVFTYVPEKANEMGAVFRFSEETGLADAKNVSAIAYLLNITDVIVPAANQTSITTGGASISYRVPAVGKLQLLKGKNEIMSFQTIVPQMGDIKTFPVDVISRDELMLEFYPEYGSLKSVRKK